MPSKGDLLKHADRAKERGLLRSASRAARVASGGQDSGAVSMPLDAIEVDQYIQVRVGGLDPETVERYRLAMRDGQQLPPITIFRDGGRYILADGFHRLEAARAEGYSEIESIIRPGGWEGAIEYAEEGNLKHGLSLTREDRRAILRRRFERGHEWTQWSTRQIAGALGVPESTLRGWIAEMNIEQPAERIGADGKRYDVRAQQASRPARQDRPQRVEYVDEYSQAPAYDEPFIVYDESEPAGYTGDDSPGAPGTAPGRPERPTRNQGAPGPRHRQIGPFVARLLDLHQAAESFLRADPDLEGFTVDQARQVLEDLSNAAVLLDESHRRIADLYGVIEQMIGGEA